MNELPAADSGEDVGQVEGGFFNSVVDIFVDPAKVFSRIERGLSWWKGYILVSVVSIIISYLSFPFQRRLMVLNQRGLSDEQLAKALESFDKFKYVGLITSPIALVIIFLVTAGIIHLVISILSSKADYKKTLSLIVLLSKGVESITSRADVNIHFSLAVFFPQLEGFKMAFLDSLGVFEIWYYVVLTFGIAYLFKLKKSSAVIPVFVIWLISLFMLAIGNKFGGGM